MTNEMNLKNEVMSFEELEKVAGGTVGELEDLVVAILDKYPGMKELSVVAVHTPGGNRLVADEVEKILKRDLNIDADISLGVGGTGLWSRSNYYRDISSGKRLSHGEVLKRIAA